MSIATIRVNTRTIGWTVVLIAVGAILVEIKELTTLLALAYGLALLLDPVIDWFEARGVSRTLAILFVGTIVFAVIFLGLILAVPVAVREVANLLDALPGYTQTLSQRLGGFVERTWGVEMPGSVDEMWLRLRENLNRINSSQIAVVWGTISQTLLRGYSLTLTVLNVFLFPFFLFYIARDLDRLHVLVAEQIPQPQRTRVVDICSEIRGYIYAFFRGQFTVSCILAVLYAVGLSIVGLPWAVAIGAISGLLNIVPYFGVGLGLILSTLIVAVTDPSVSQFGMVWGVFGVVQLLEGNLITPKIVGESVGLHPLVVMIALIIGGSLLGLLGMVLAIPGAAAVRVLIRHFLLEDNRGGGSEEAVPEADATA